MLIEKVRSLLNSNDLKTFNDVLSHYKMEDNVHHEIIDFTDVKNFIVKTTFQSFPKTGLVCFNDGEITSVNCY